MFRILFSSAIILLLFSCSNSTKHNEAATFLETIPGDYMFMKRAYPTGTINDKAFKEAIQWKKNINRSISQNEPWQFAAPFNIGGRITDIHIPSNQPQTYYVGAASGGIFKSINAGADWFPIFDNESALAIGDIETSNIDNNLVWVGTGEPNGGGGSLTYSGNGIYKSEDAGENWLSKGLENVGSIAKVVIDPNNNNIVFAGAMGPLFRNDENRGIYKTIDGGTSWTKVLFINDQTGIADMAIHPTNSNIIYATSWERIRRPDYNQYGGAFSNIYRSTDGGNNWTILTNGLPTSPSQKGRISIDISKSNPNVLYAQFCDASGGLQGVYKTINGGDSWVEINSSALTNVGFNYWFGGIFIDPTNENTVYYIGFTPQKSINGGTTWQDAFPNVHVDQHALAFNNSVAGEILLGNDGGFYKSTNGGNTSTKVLNLPITQFSRIFVNEQNENSIIGGAQDNSTVRTQTGSATNWNTIYGGDGFQPLIDPQNSAIIYALSQYGNLGKSTNNGSSFSNATNGISSSEPKNWDTPILFDPSNSQILYYGSNRVYKTTNGAGSWTAISPDLTNGPYNGNLVFGTIVSIDVSALNSNLIYAGTDDGNIWATQNGGTNWELLSENLPNRWVTKVYASPTNLNTVYATYSGYRYGEDSGHIYKSFDAGINWLDISGNLPDIPLNDVVKDNFGNLYIATDAGVLASADEGLNWQPLDFEMPPVVVTDLFIHENSQKLFAATFGRSIYKLDVSTNILSTENNSIGLEVKMYPNPASEFVNIEVKNSSQTKIEIYNIEGKLILKHNWEANSNSIQLQLNEIKSGIYFLKINKGKNSATKKLIVN